MVRLNKIALALFVIGGIITMFVLVLADDKDRKSFNDMSIQEKNEFLENQITKYKAGITELIQYFEQDWKWEQNWDKEKVQVNFCNLIKEYRAKEAVSLLVKHFDLIAYYGKESPITISNRFVLSALAEIGTPALEPVTEKICSELGSLKYSEDTRHRIFFLRQALKSFSVEVLGKKLAIVFLEDKISGKDVSPQLKENISTILEEIKQDKWIEKIGK